MSVRHGRVWSVLGVCLLAGCAQARAASPEPGFAVVELFTSEGCSSCPPADDVLGELTQEAEHAGRAVYTLAFHVDYWDNSAWRDPYSASWATQQQRAYADALHGRGLYTPQMVVNGRDEFIGSRGAQARSSIASALEDTRRSQLQLAAHRDGERIVAHYALSRAVPAGTVLRVALVEAEAATQVQAGENAGRTLRHVHVVRAFQTVTLRESSGDVSLSWPSGFTPVQRDGASIVAYVQQSSSMQISAAARASLSPNAG